MLEYEHGVLQRTTHSNTSSHDIGKMRPYLPGTCWPGKWTFRNTGRGASGFPPHQAGPSRANPRRSRCGEYIAGLQQRASSRCG
jgi:hypothetical protein